MHTFYGGKSLWPTKSFDDLVALSASETSGPIEENKSLYWHPSIYHVDENGNYQIQETTLSVYYIWDPNDTNVTAFPPGFAMIAGRGEEIDTRAEYGNAMTTNPRMFHFFLRNSALESSTLVAVCPTAGTDKIGLRMTTMSRIPKKAAMKFPILVQMAILRFPNFGFLSI